MIKKLYFILFGWLTLPHISLYLVSHNKQVINEDVDRWTLCAQISKSALGGGKHRLLNLIWLLLFFSEYRNVFYLRIGKLKHFLYYLRPLASLQINTPSDKFGAGTYIQHGLATIIAAKSIGKNCWINQQVTIGYNDSHKYGYGQPTIGNNVRISAGAKVCGNITVGDNSTIGVNAVAIKDVPENSIVIPSPMMLIRERGQKVYKKL